MTRRTLTDQSRELLRDAVLYILNFHHGHAQAISRDEFLHQLLAHGQGAVDERDLRSVIHDLRTEGNLIISSGGIKGGYWMAAGWEEVEEYLDHEVHARAMDLLEQERIIRHSAALEFGPKPSPQMELLSSASTANIRLERIGA